MNIFSQILRYAMPMLPLLVIALLCWKFSQSALWRGRWAGEQDEFIPDSAPRLGIRWRALQAGAVALIGLCVVGTVGNAPLLNFGAMQTAKALILGAVTAAAVLGILLGAFLTLAGGTGWGCMLAALSIVAFMTMTMGSWSAVDQLCPGNAAEAQTVYSFQVNDNLPGVEIWVNNVYLGKTPLRVSREEFLAKVPFKTEIPGVVTQKKIGNQSYPQINDSTWNRFSVSEPSSYNPDVMRSQTMAAGQGNHPTYFARARFDGEWGKSSGGSSSGGSGSRYQFIDTFNLGFTFPKLEARVNDLLSQARTAGFHPTPDWFKALESLNPPAWRIITEQAARDPQMRTMRDAWAAWHYGLDQATTPGAAWRVMEAIAREAEEKHAFNTATPAGRAVALLAPQLDLPRLVGEAMRLMRNNRGYFSYSYRNSGSPDGLDFSYSTDSNPNGVTYPMRAYVIAQAIRTIGEQIKAKTGQYPPSFQTQLAPEIVRSFNGNETFLTLAANYGGPEVEQYLLRQPWDKAPKQGDYENVTWDAGVNVNKWLKLLAGMNNEIGRRFCAAHHQAVLELARQYLSQNHSPLWVNFRYLTFIFNDPQLAMEFWPEIKSKARESNDIPNMECKWQYLVKMEPATTLELYQEAWREDMADRTLIAFNYNIFNALDSLPTKRRGEVLKMIQIEAQTELSKIDPDGRKRDSRAIYLDQALKTIERKLSAK